jgi:hypothetical protein
MAMDGKSPEEFAKVIRTYGNCSDAVAQEN